MASHKSLKSVVRSMVDSFTSLMNHAGDDYRGKVYAHEVNEWWYPEKAPPRPEEKPWWKFW